MDRHGKRRKKKKRSVDVCGIHTGDANAQLDALLGLSPPSAPAPAPKAKKPRLMKPKTFTLEERGHPGVNMLEGLALYRDIVTPEKERELIAWADENVARGLRGELEGVTFHQASKVIRGNGRQVLQYGAHYNFGQHRIEPEAAIAEIPPLIEALIDELTDKGALPVSVRPDTVIVNVYNEGDCIPPHIDHEVYPRPFSTLSLLSAAPMLLGSWISADGGGGFRAPFRTTLPRRSLMVFNSGNGADVAKHCVPPVVERRISITLRRMPDFARKIVAERLERKRGSTARGCTSATASAEAPASVQRTEASHDVGAAVWDPAAPPCAEATSAFASAAFKTLAAHPPRLGVSVSLAERTLLRKLRGVLERECVKSLTQATCARFALKTSVTLRNGDAAWERFLLCWCCDGEGGGPSADTAQGDGIQPQLLREGSRLTNALDSLRSEIFSAGADPGATEAVVRALSSAAATSARRLRSSRTKLNAASTRPIDPTQRKKRRELDLGVRLVTLRPMAPKTSLSGKVKRGRFSLLPQLEVACGDVSHVVNAAHVAKLRELHRRATAAALDVVRGTSGADETEATVAAECRLLEVSFRQRLFALLTRYDAFTGGGTGFQAACNDSTFEVLKRRFGVRCEVFASPLNCRWSHFCSAFPDTDAAFGSLGSFFDFTPTSGSFEANPPFVTAIIERMARHIDVLLLRAPSSSPLSFVVIVPDWSEASGKRCAALTGSRFLSRELVVKNREHTYHEGRQHSDPRPRHLRRASCDTRVFFLQNSRGAARWPATDDACAELEVAFGHCGGGSGGAPRGISSEGRVAQFATDANGLSPLEHALTTDVQRAPSVVETSAARPQGKRRTKAKTKKRNQRSKLRMHT